MPTAVNIEDALLFSIAQKGKRYVFGAEGRTDAYDCSELVEQSCLDAGIRPVVPDGAYYQWRHCTKHKRRISVAEGIRTRGALLFVGDGTGTGRDAITHVAWSLGDGTTIEARGKAWGVGVFPSAGRFDYAGLIPGAAYGRPKVAPTKQPAARPVLRRGSRGVAVEYLQTVLRKRGFRGLDGKLIAVDGKYGPSTEAVVVSVQLWCQVTDDGIVGPQTWKIIDQLARA